MTLADWFVIIDAILITFLLILLLKLCISVWVELRRGSDDQA